MVRCSFFCTLQRATFIHRIIYLTQSASLYTCPYQSFLLSLSCARNTCLLYRVPRNNFIMVLLNKMVLIVSATKANLQKCLLLVVCTLYYSSHGYTKNFCWVVRFKGFFLPYAKLEKLVDTFRVACQPAFVCRKRFLIN